MVGLETSHNRIFLRAKYEKIGKFRLILQLLPVRVNRQVISPSIIASVNTFFVFYLFCALVGWTLLMFFGVGLTEAMSTVISSLGNVGPGLGAFGPAFSWAALPDAAKWVLSFLMLIGRLELFAVLLLFYSGFWER